MKYFSDGAIVGFRSFGLGKIENVVLETEGVKKYGWGPFRVKDVVEDRNGIQLHIETGAEEDSDPILSVHWFVDWEE